MTIIEKLTSAIALFFCDSRVARFQADVDRAPLLRRGRMAKPINAAVMFLA